MSILQKTRTLSKRMYCKVISACSIRHSGQERAGLESYATKQGGHRHMNKRETFVLDDNRTKA
jgi:hypothetical protein